MQNRSIVFIYSVFVPLLALAARPASGENVVPKVMGISLTELGTHVYDAAPPGSPPTEAQIMVDRLAALGIQQINLSPRAFMKDPRGSEVIPAIQGAERSKERDRYLRLIRYIHDKGISVGIRPMFFVVDANGNTPLRENLPDGSVKEWWHGNIQPQDPNAWFESFKTFLDIYLPVVRAGKVEEFTIGAELYSMTVGIEDQWMENPHGFPGRWVELLKHVRSKVGAGTRLMYDINFTDDKVAGNGQSIDEFGGEMVRWRYRLVDLADRENPAEKQIWQDLVDFWKGLDAIGIDMYRSLATVDMVLPSTEAALAGVLAQTAERYATQIDNILFDIEGVTGVKKPVLLKEVGFRSVENGFISPFTYSGSGTVNIPHQVAAYKAVIDGFWKPGWDWMAGIVFWDASVDPSKHGVMDNGFSPVGKPSTEKLLRQTIEESQGMSSSEEIRP